MFTDLDAVKKLLRIPDDVTDDDEVITLVVEAVNAELLAFFNLTDTDATEYAVSCDLHAEGRRIPNVRIGPRPVISVADVVLWGSELDADQWILRPPDVLKFVDGTPVGSSRGMHADGPEVEAFTATVTAGWADELPKNLTYGAAMLAAARFRADPRADLKSERFGRYGYERMTAQEVAHGFPPDYPAFLVQALAPYQRLMAMPTARPRLP